MCSPYTPNQHVHNPVHSDTNSLKLEVPCLQPSSQLSAHIIVGEFKILETNLKSEEIITFILYLYRF